ncbi:Panacea domain-containing protein [Paenibacillus sp. CMAA1739]|uniref:Panacea domain-containing protein n=1 Tax=Paenibacillus ottowii TaxID=2315729 RepID=UPI002DBBEB21|nr:Panacea domain-containing protein [Paenibacillus sp. CMAA1739]MEC4565328.1 Panacea domain-containing protein [Paenibacillus sp. CMAA1739]
MASINYILRYFAHKYPYKSELSKTRITKMIYLADWKSTQKFGSQITDIVWYFDQYGPHADNVYSTALKDKKLMIQHERTVYGYPKDVIIIKKTGQSDRLGFEFLTVNELEVLNEVIEDTKHLNLSEFIDYVFDTFPLKNESKNKVLNLVKLAELENTTQKTILK